MELTKHTDIQDSLTADSYAMRVLYARGEDRPADDHVRAIVAQAAPDCRLTFVEATAAIEELAAAGTQYQALFTSPGLDAEASTGLISRVRAGRLPIPVLCLQHRPDAASFSAAVTAEADAVLAIDDCTPAQVQDVLHRLRQSPHFHAPDEPRRLRLLYVGTDWLVWKLLELAPFVAGERAECGPDGACPIQADLARPGALRCDAVLVDQQPGNAKPGDVIRWLKRHAPELPMVVLTRTEVDGTDASAIEHEADDIVVKTGVYRPRLLTALRRLHRLHAVTLANASLTARAAWLHQVVDELADAVLVLSPFGTVLAANQAALAMLRATAIADLLDAPLAAWVDEDYHEEVSAAIGRAAGGESPEVRLALARRAGSATVIVRLQALGRGSPSRAGVLVRFVSEPVDATVRAEREAWEARRRALEAQVAEAARHEAEARTAQTAGEAEEARLVAARAEAERAQWESERAAHDAARQELEDSLASADAGRREAEARLEVADATRQDLEHRLAVAQATGRSIETRLNEVVQTAADDRRKLCADTDEVRAALEAERTRHQDERQAWGADRQLWESAWAAWDTDRRELESRIESLNQTRHDLEAQVGALATARQELNEHLGSLDQVKQRLEQELREKSAGLEGATDAHRQDREAWEATRCNLEARAAELTAHAGDLAQVESELADARQQLEQAQAGHAADRDTWNAGQRDLEARVGELTARAGDLQRVESELADARQQLEQAQAGHAADRDAWNAGQRDLEARVAELTAHAGDLAQVESELADARQQLEQAQAGHAADRDAWNAGQRDLEARVAELAARTGDLARVESELADARQQLEQAQAGHAADRDTWNAGQRDLEARVAAAVVASQQREEDARRAELAARLASGTSALERLAGCELFGYAVTTADGQLATCNETFARLFGHASADAALADASFKELAHADGHSDASGSTPRVAERVTLRDGREIWLLRWTRALPAGDAGAARLEHIVVDVTREAQRDERLREARRLGRVSALTARMAPDLAALVRSLRDAAGRLASAPAGSDAARDLLAGLEQPAAAAGDLLQQLAAFSRRHEQPRDRCALDDRIARALPALRPLAGADVALEVRPGASEAVYVAQDELDRLLTSLTIAARDLLPSGGRVTLATRRPDPLDWLPAADTPGPIPPVRLEVTAEGYDVQPPAVTPALERVVAQCDGLLRARQTGAHRVTFDVDLPMACAGR
jgi:septal ring factor EnvC (AmiA/AmiB activator)